jgi:hypothetical protein
VQALHLTAVRGVAHPAATFLAPGAVPILRHLHSDPRGPIVSAAPGRAAAESADYPSDVTLYYPFRQEVPGALDAAEARERTISLQVCGQVAQLLRDMESHGGSEARNRFHGAAKKLTTGSQSVTAYFSAASIDPVAEQLAKYVSESDVGSR